MSVFIMIAESFALCSALSIDALVSSFAYGANKIKIPFRSAMAINVTCSLILGIALLLGQFVGNYIPAEITAIICCCILFTIGLLKLFDGIIKSWIRKHSDWDKELNFSIFGLGILLKIYARPEKADADGSKILSVREAVVLAVALSLDGLAVGFSVGMATAEIWVIFAVSFVTDLAAVILGCFLGNKFAKVSKLNLSWLSGLVLIALGISKLF